MEIRDTEWAKEEFRPENPVLIYKIIFQIRDQISLGLESVDPLEKIIQNFCGSGFG
jgi:hypothetical protein